MKAAERADAIRLRHEGLRYSDLTRRFGVAKSTLWRWLKAEGLVETQPQRLTEMKRAAQQRGAAIVKARRLARTRAILEQASHEVGALSRRDVWLLGLALYWAEGSKQKPGNVSAGVIFTNSDPAAIRAFVAWITESCGVSKDRLTFEIYLHETADATRAQLYWSAQLQLPIEQLSRIRWKHHRPATRRTNVGDSYHGLVRVRVARSSALNRRIAGWIAGVGNSLGSGATVAQLTLDQQIPGSIPGSPAIVYLDNGESFEVRDEQAEGTRVRVAEYGAMTYT